MWVIVVSWPFGTMMALYAPREDACATRVASQGAVSLNDPEVEVKQITCDLLIFYIVMYI